MTKKRGITGSTLKIIALVTMFIDHVAATILESYMYSTMPESEETEALMEWTMQHGGLYLTYMVMRLIGRLGFPLFAFLLVEGVVHTGNAIKYAGNLAVFALISEIPFNLAISKEVWSIEYQNVFFTLFIGMVTLVLIRRITAEVRLERFTEILFYLSGMATGVLVAELFVTSIFGEIYMSVVGIKGILYLVGAILGLMIVAKLGREWNVERKNSYAFTAIILMAAVLLAAYMRTDYGAWGVFTIAVMYYYRNKPVKAMGMGCLALTVMSFIECTAFLAMIPVAKYNGQRGLKLKYFFYAFYPAHLLILAVLTKLIV